MSIDTLVEKFFISLLDNDMSDIQKETILSKKVKYKISPKVKALEMGYVCPDNLSIDYKKEIREGRIRKEL